MGDPVAIFTYKTPDGNLWYYEARYEVALDSGKVRKEPRCWTWGQRGAMPPKWECGFPQKPRPFYGLDEIANAKQVLVLEGPRKAEAARKMLNGTSSIACVGWPGGALGVKYADWSLLEGKELLLLPDADPIGKEAMNEVAKYANAKTIYSIDVSDLPKGFDTADMLDDGWNKKQFIEFLKARKQPYTAPVELDDKKDTPAPAPVDAYMDSDAPLKFSDIRHHPDGRTGYDEDSFDSTFPPDPIDLFSTYIVPPLKSGMLPDVIQRFVDDRANIINTDPAFGALACIVNALLA